MDYITLNETQVGKDKEKVKNTLISLIESRDAEVEMEQNPYHTDNEIEATIISENIKSTKKYKRNKALKETKYLKENYTKDLLGYVMMKTLKESLIFDEAYLIENGDYLEKQMKEFVSESFKQDFITANTFAESGNIVCEDIVDEVLRYADKLVESNEDERSDIVSEFTSMTFLEETIDSIATKVQKKVKDVTKREKDLSEINKKQEEIKQEQGLLKVDKYENTLFRSLYEACVPAIVNESEGSIDSKEILGEAVFYYTLIECLNTMELVKINGNNANSFARYIRNASKMGK